MPERHLFDYNIAEQTICNKIRGKMQMVDIFIIIYIYYIILHPQNQTNKLTSGQGLSQRPDQPSFGRPIFSLDIEKYRPIPPNCIGEEPRVSPGPTISKFGLPFIISWLNPCPWWLFRILVASLKSPCC